MNMKIPVKTLMTIPAHELMTILPAQRAEEYSSQSADDNDDDILQTEVSHVQLPTVCKKYHDNYDDNTLHKMVYGPTYVPYNEDGQKTVVAANYRYVTKRQSEIVIQFTT